VHPAQLLAIALLVAVLGLAVTRPRGLPEWAGAVPAAALVVATGALTPAAALTEVRDLLPVVLFLVAVLVLAHACDEEGLFAAVGDRLAHTDGGPGAGGRLLTRVFLAAALTTAVLSLDATVVLLTPVVLAAALRARTPARPHVYACAHLANSASLLLPVSNLTNLLAFSATGLSFTGFAARMALPWGVAVGAELVVFRRWFRDDLAAAGSPDPAPVAPLPRFALATVAAVLVGFVLSTPTGVAPVWWATAGAAVLVARSAVRGRLQPRSVVRAASPGFGVFVLALGVVVKAVSTGGLGSAIGRVLPDGSSFAALLGVAAGAAVLANLLNNLPATLLVVPLLTAGGPAPGPVLAALLGVNIGPNLTYAGSLATLLWRRVLQRSGHRHDGPVAFTRLGLVSVPITLVASVAALWLALQVLGD
jgi:arsenical pump membrane protein